MGTSYRGLGRGAAPPAPKEAWVWGVGCGLLRLLRLRRCLVGRCELLLVAVGYYSSTVDGWYNGSRYRHREGGSLPVPYR